MKPARNRTNSWYLTLAIAVAALTLVACGGDANTNQASSKTIQTDKGLSVAAISGSQTGGAGGDSEASRQAGGRGGSAAGGPQMGGAAGGGGGSVMQLLQSNDGITVQGYGSATVDAEGAMLDLQLFRDANAPLDTPGPRNPLPSPRPPNEAEVQPLIDALLEAGVPAENIQFMVQACSSYSCTAQNFRVILPAVDSIAHIVEVAYQAADNSVLDITGINVAYTLNDCTVLEEAAMRAAVEDANERAGVLARTLAVGLGGVIGASNYSYLGSTPCEASGSLPTSGSGSVPYVEGQPRQVQIVANIAVTFAIQ